MTPLTMFDNDEGPLIDSRRLESVRRAEGDDEAGYEGDDHRENERDAAPAGLRHSPPFDGAEYSGDENEGERDVELS
jgi:hypothetical protein